MHWQGGRVVMALVLGLHQSPVGNFAGSNPVLVIKNFCFFSHGGFCLVLVQLSTGVL